MKRETDKEKNYESNCRKCKTDFTKNLGGT